ncbi:MAG: hypothetical protein H6816_13650 [Phycisphaerales bacterium]|nr:hypothetical protein [Phycisphaerales bacterium]
MRSEAAEQTLLDDAVEARRHSREESASIAPAEHAWIEQQTQGSAPQR